MPDIYVGVGSNIDSEANIAKAVEMLRNDWGAIESSSVYRNPAVGFVGDDFLNLVLRFQSSIDAVLIGQLLDAFEQRAGRERTSAGLGSRSLDLDLLLYGSLIDASLRLPHEDILRYSFVLCPLAELAPTLSHPVTGISIAESWGDLAQTKPILKNIGSPADIVAGENLK